jgi:hypothetical protein
LPMHHTSMGPPGTSHDMKQRRDVDYSARAPIAHSLRTRFFWPSSGSTNAAERPKSLMHDHTVVVLRLSASSKQNGKPLGLNHIAFAFEDLVSFDTCTVLADRIKETGFERTSRSDLISPHYHNVVARRLHLPLLGFQRSPLRREITCRPVPSHTTKSCDSSVEECHSLDIFRPCCSNQLRRFTPVCDCELLPTHPDHGVHTLALGCD